jgi:hypothetical protein
MCQFLFTTRKKKILFFAAVFSKLREDEARSPPSPVRKAILSFLLVEYGL